MSKLKNKRNFEVIQNKVGEHVKNLMNQENNIFICAIENGSAIKTLKLLAINYRHSQLGKK